MQSHTLIQNCSLFWELCLHQSQGTEAGSFYFVLNLLWFHSWCSECHLPPQVTSSRSKSKWIKSNVKHPECFCKFFSLLQMNCSVTESLSVVTVQKVLGTKIISAQKILYNANDVILGICYCHLKFHFSKLLNKVTKII